MRQATAARERADWPSVLSAYERACALGDANGCDAWGGLLCVGAGDQVPRDEQRCMELTAKACDMGAREACRATGNLYSQGSRDGTSFPRDLERAFQIYEKTCRAGDGASCARLAYCYEDGDGVKRNPKLAKQYRWMAGELGFVGE